MKRGSFAAGFLTCLLLAGITTTAYAAGIMAERSTHRIYVNGREVQMEAYVINGNNYVKLRDIGEQVCFNVGQHQRLCAGGKRKALHRNRAGESGDQRTCFTAGGYDACR